MSFQFPGPRAHNAARSTDSLQHPYSCSFLSFVVSISRIVVRLYSGHVAVVLVGSLRGVGQLLESLGDDADTLAQLLLGDDHRGGEADNVAVSGLGLKQAD